MEVLEKPGDTPTIERPDQSAGERYRGQSGNSAEAPGEGKTILRLTLPINHSTRVLCETL